MDRSGVRSRRTRAGLRGGAAGGVLVVLVAGILHGCEATPARTAPPRAQDAISDEAFAALVERISEPGGYFDTDNLISNESGYLKVIDALAASEPAGGVYVGVGPDQSFSYIATLRPTLAFIVDVRRDNLLHHLLLKALVERAPTRVDFLSSLHGRPAPDDAESWRDRSIREIVDYVDGVEPDPARFAALGAEVDRAVTSYGLRLSREDRETIRRFHQAFVDAGLGLRFTSYGRPPRPYYPTYRQLVLETDWDGDAASYLATAERYAVVRELHLANRIVPVVGDLAGAGAIEEMGRVMREMDLSLTAFYTSNVEFYLWRSGTFGRWLHNLSALPASADAVVIRSYFPNFGGRHPSSVVGYYSTQTLQPVSVLLAGDFGSYWDVVTRNVVDLRPAAVR